MINDEITHKYTTYRIEFQQTYNRSTHVITHQVRI